MTQKKLIILGGPNGCGKSTLAEFLKKNQQLSFFLNADTIARGLGESPKSEIDAGRLLLRKIEDLLGDGESFSFETTLSGRTWIHVIELAKQHGYHVEIYFIFVDTVDIAVDRVAARVRRGGHNIPEETIRRRFGRSIKNFKELYQGLADNWWLLNNTSAFTKMIAKKPNGSTIVLDESSYQHFQSL